MAKRPSCASDFVSFVGYDLAKKPRKPLRQRVSRPKGVRKFHAALYQKLRGIVAEKEGFELCPTACIWYKLL